MAEQQSELDIGNKPKTKEERAAERALRREKIIQEIFKSMSPQQHSDNYRTAFRNTFQEYWVQFKFNNREIREFEWRFLNKLDIQPQDLITEKQFKQIQTAWGKSENAIEEAYRHYWKTHSKDKQSRYVLIAAALGFGLGVTGAGIGIRQADLHADQLGEGGIALIIFAGVCVAFLSPSLGSAVKAYQDNDYKNFLIEEGIKALPDGLDKVEVEESKDTVTQSLV